MRESLTAPACGKAGTGARAVSAPGHSTVRRPALPLYVLDYRYADPELRARVRQRHLAYLTSLLDDGTLVMAGPWADQSGAMVVFRAADEEGAWALVEADPYTIEGVT